MAHTIDPSRPLDDMSEGEIDAETAALTAALAHKLRESQKDERQVSGGPDIGQLPHA